MNDDVVIPVVAILMPLVLVPLVMVLKQRSRRREQEHRERMRALDLGVLPARPERSTFWPAMAAIAIGFGVPAAAFLFAWLAALTAHVGDAIWGAVAGVSVVALICGTVLAVRLVRPRPARPSAASRPYDWDHATTTAKPAAFDPDAFDTVSRRG